MNVFSEIIQDAKSKIQEHKQNTMLILLVINITFFIFINVFIVLFNIFSLNKYFNLNILDAFTLVSFQNHFSTRFFTLFTYMFSHFGFFHLLTNMLLMLLFGQVIENLLGTKKLMLLYVLGGIIGGISFVIFCSLNSNYYSQTLIGASSSVLAIIAAASFLAPNYLIRLLVIGKIKLKYISAIIILLFLISSNSVGVFSAHLGGFLFGFFYIFYLNRNIDFFDYYKKLIRPSSNHPKAKIQENRTNKILSNEQKKQEKLDEILDKINASGYHNLSIEEKEFLQKISNE
jgi:membrane associated rhomboid family serine protease